MANLALIPCFGENICIRLLELTLKYNILLIYIYIGLHAIYSFAPSFILITWLMTLPWS